MGLVDDYLTKVPTAERAELERIRKLVIKQLPEATEVISYGMPGFTYKSKYLLGYAAFKDHLSLFPTSQPIELLHGKLDGYKLARGTIQFTLENKLSDELIKEIISLRTRALDG
jgi:uncharacterized protein YdhG (YjbR/CyaY superfamily)